MIRKVRDVSMFIDTPVRELRRGLNADTLRLGRYSISRPAASSSRRDN